MNTGLTSLVELGRSPLIRRNNLLLPQTPTHPFRVSQINKSETRKLPNTIWIVLCVVKGSPYIKTLHRHRHRPPHASYSHIHTYFLFPSVLHLNTHLPLGFEVTVTLTVWAQPGWVFSSATSKISSLRAILSLVGFFFWLPVHYPFSLSLAALFSGPPHRFSPLSPYTHICTLFLSSVSFSVLPDDLIAPSEWIWALCLCVFTRTCHARNIHMVMRNIHFWKGRGGWKVAMPQREGDEIGDMWRTRSPRTVDALLVSSLSICLQTTGFCSFSLSLQLSHFFSLASTQPSV